LLQQKKPFVVLFLFHPKNGLSFFEKAFIIGTMNKFILHKHLMEKELQVKKLKLHIDKSEACADLYNKAVLEKAILKKEYEEANKNPVIETIKKLIPKREKLICDYFKG